MQVIIDVLAIIGVLAVAAVLLGLLGWMFLLWGEIRDSGAYVREQHGIKSREEVE